MTAEINYIDLFNDQLNIIKNLIEEMENQISKFSSDIELCNDNKRDIMTIKNNLLF